MFSRTGMIIMVIFLAGANIVFAVVNRSWFNAFVAVYILAVPGRTVATMKTTAQRRRQRLLLEAMDEVDDVDVIVTLDEIDQQRPG